LHAVPEVSEPDLSTEQNCHASIGEKSPEKLARQIEQLELRLEDLQSKAAESASQPESKSAATTPPLLI